MVRSFASIVLAYVTWTALWFAGNGTLSAVLPGAFRADGSTDHPGLLLTILGWSVVVSLVSGYLAAIIAPAKPLVHGAVLAALLLVTGIFVQLQYWNLLPLWYHICFLVLLVPSVMFGTALRVRQSSGSHLAHA